ncbi:MAG: amidohydrolase family protein [Novosphingobium sp.]|nr:amidohydrolase family protein [Novosphingobium sp.]
MDYKVISADDHICEPRDLFVTRMPEKYRDRAPRVMRGEDGGDGWSFDGKTVPRTLGIEATAGREIRISGYKWEEILPGNYDGAAHLEDMKVGDIDAAVMFPAVGMTAWSMKDDPFALAMAQAYNDWMIEDFCSPDPDRLIGLPMLPVNHGIDATLAELDRSMKKGAKAVTIPVFPDVPYIDEQWAPLWSAVEESGAPLCMHRTSGGNDPAGKGTFNFDIPGLNVAGSVIRFFAGVEPLTNLTFTGVFDRHPKLKFVHAEINFGWVPFWKNTMDECWEKQKGWAQFPFDHRPSDVIGKNVFVTVLDDKLGFDLIKDEPYLADTAMFSTDYPHSFCLWPDTQKFVKELTADIDRVAREKVLAGNAARVFNLN